MHAINSAALAWSVTRACSKGDLAECSCDNSIRRKQRKWQWGGCSEDINYGVMFSRKFIDSQESNVSVGGILNLHNNEAGRRVSNKWTKDLGDKSIDIGGSILISCLFFYLGT